ncbi:MAG TPA: urate hydroxylase PuuD [Bacteroidia bacterium]|nr:urate hydroxylase PuuD [Bacteroidia bacterium]
MGPHVLDWLHLVIRWAHVVFGIAWIGASFYFIFLENSLNRTEDLRDELAGNLWAIHGGGFYYIEKYKIAPGEIPKTLHWFKYEAYFTWLTGLILLLLVYYFNAKAYMLDPAVSGISANTSIIIGIGTLIIGWFIYDLLCKTSLLQRKKTFAVIGFAIVTIIAYILSQLLSGRAAFMHVGALIGTIMVGNVFFTIIPSQKAMVRAAKKGLPLNPNLGKNAGLRSLHNNYMTLPVIFVMISNHFPATYGPAFNWIVLSILTLASVAVRHFINLHEQGRHARWMLPFAAIALIALVMVTSPSKVNLSSNEMVTFSEAQAIIQKRCVSCHSQNPTDDTQTVTPNGVMFDTPEEIHKMADRIMVRAIQTKTMPQANKTQMTEEEREILGRWILQGAKLN